MPYVPHVFRLKHGDQVVRWEELAGYARRVPARPGVIVYRNVLDGSRELGAQRDAEDPSMIFFTVFEQEDLDAVGDAVPGQGVGPVHTEYKVNDRVPFIVRHIGHTDMRSRGEDGLELASSGRMSLREKIRLVRTALTTGALIPGIEELDELLVYLRDAEEVVTRPGG